MGTPVGLAMFAALVAAITVVAAMTVVGALALLYYSTGEAPSDAADDVTHLHLPRPLLPAVAPVAPGAQAEQAPAGTPYPPDGTTRIDTPRMSRLLPPFEEEESSLNRDLAPYPRPNRAGWADPAWAHATGPRRVGGPSRFDRPALSGTRPSSANAAFGSPEWTEEEGATEIFSAHNLGDMSEFAFVDEEVPASRR